VRGRLPRAATPAAVHSAQGGADRLATNRVGTLALTDVSFQEAHDRPEAQRSSLSASLTRQPVRGSPLFGRPITLPCQMALAGRSRISGTRSLNRLFPQLLPAVVFMVLVATVARSRRTVAQVNAAPESTVVRARAIGSGVAVARERRCVCRCLRRRRDAGATCFQYALK
jgi:hypothetical protein